MIVANRKGTAAPVASILPSLVAACGNWAWRTENLWPSDELEQIEFAVAEANTLTITVYDIHPFIDGNTRATWHLRNYLLMLAGLPPMIDLVDQARYEESWWSASPTDHEELDRCVLEELRAQESR